MIINGRVALDFLQNGIFFLYGKGDAVLLFISHKLYFRHRIERNNAVCKSIFKNHSEGIKAIRMSNVQQYFRSGYRYFYDLKSIIQEAGASAQELKDLEDALKKCVLYGAFTPKFMEEFRILTYSGFSMYLPRDISTAFYFEELNSYYKTLEWNKATELVK